MPNLSSAVVWKQPLWIQTVLSLCLGISARCGSPGQPDIIFQVYFSVYLSSTNRKSVMKWCNSQPAVGNAASPLTVVFYFLVILLQPLHFLSALLHCGRCLAASWSTLLVKIFALFFDESKSHCISSVVHKLNTAWTSLSVQTQLKELLFSCQMFHRL